MSLHGIGRAPVGWRGGRIVIFAAAIVFGGFVALGAMSSGYALLGFVVVLLSALLASRATDESDRLARPVAVAERAGEPLEAVIAGVPDAVIALDRNGRVLTLNDAARSLAPALRQNEPVSLALRMPELIEAIGRAYATGDEQRVEYSERVPIDRWFEVIVKPVRRDPKLQMPDLVLMTFHDLTPLRRVEEMRADFVANASHELRTPLAALSGFIETLQGSAKDDARARERFLRHHARAGAAHGAADRRSVVAVAHRAECAPAPRYAGRCWSRSSGKSPTVCKPWRAIAA